MKELFYHSLFGFVQGITEFLPVSSSGHIAILKNIFGITTKNLFFETSLHLGTFFSLLVFFRTKIIDLLKGMYSDLKDKKGKKENINFVSLVLIGIIPAAIAGMLMNDFVEKVFSDLFLIGIFYLILSLILFSTKFSKNRMKSVNIFESIVVGLFQTISLLPGISRSGTTISTALFLGVEPEKASDFSFFMAMPIILGSFIKEFIDVKFFFDMNIFAGILISFLTGYLALVVLYKVLRSKKFYLFSIYTLLIGLFLVLWKIKEFF
ncbi:MAG: undecaprenyl-diphosphate phosphatase [candidate division WOR-3 bacterium]